MKQPVPWSGLLLVALLPVLVESRSAFHNEAIFSVRGGVNTVRIPVVSVDRLHTSPESKRELNRALSPDPSLRETVWDPAVRVVGTLTQALFAFGRAVVPPMVTVARTILRFYRGLPTDAIKAQIGLVYCFAGGYYPTLFSSLQAAQQCGWDIAVSAVQDLTEEAVDVLQAASNVDWEAMERREALLEQCTIVLQTVDPVKINQAAAALYTTWLGVSAVLEKEYARVISMSLALADSMERVAHWVLEPVVKCAVSTDYHKWVPVAIGWLCKAMAMNIAWRLQRVLTASTSAVAGGLMFSRAILRILHRRGIRFFGWLDETGKESPLDEVIGFFVAGIGFWTQIEAQYKHNFSFQVPFPWSLVTWPLDWSERWIQWQITKRQSGKS